MNSTKTRRPTTTERLISRIRKEAPEHLLRHFPENPRPDSLRQGPNARSAGAWSWMIELSDGNLVGSQQTMTKLVAAKEIAFSRYITDWDIDGV